MLRRSAIWDVGMQRKGAFGVGNMSLVWGILFLLLWIHHSSSSQHIPFPVASQVRIRIHQSNFNNVFVSSMVGDQHELILVQPLLFSLPAETFPPEALYIYTHYTLNCYEESQLPHNSQAFLRVAVDPCRF